MASRIRCASPPESVEAARSIERDVDARSLQRGQDGNHCADGFWEQDADAVAGAAAGVNEERGETIGILFNAAVRPFFAEDQSGLVRTRISVCGQVMLKEPAHAAVARAFPAERRFAFQFS